MLASNLQRVTQVVLVVITAPGVETLPFDPRKCRVYGRHKCSGAIGCRVDERARDAWEATMQERWCSLREATVMQLAREGLSSPLVAWGDEDQRRGVWHRNLVLRFGTASVRFVQVLSELAPRYGFGYVDRLATPRPGIAAGSYMAGYIASGSGKKDGASVRDIAQRSPSRRRVWWVSPKLTKRSNVTMTALRNGRRMWAASEGLISRPTEGVAVVDWVVIDLATGAVLNHVWTLEGDGGEEA